MSIKIKWNNIELLSKRRIVREAGLTPKDFHEINRRRRMHNRLGFAYQLTFVRLFNRLPKTQPLEVMDDILSYVSAHLHVPSNCINDYQSRRPTISEHQAGIIEYLGLNRYDKQSASLLQAFLFEQSCRLEQTVALEVQAREFLREHRILEPAEGTLSRFVAEQRVYAREHIFARIIDSISETDSQQLEALLELEMNETVSPLQKIKVNPRKPSPEAISALFNKLKYIEATGILEINLSWLNRNYQRALFHRVRKHSAYALKQLTRPHRLASLICFLHQSYRDTIDQAVDMFGKLMTHVASRAEGDLDRAMQQQKKMFRQSLELSRYVATVLLNPSLSAHEQVMQIVEKYPPEELQTIVEETDEWVAGKKSHAFHLVMKRYGYLRKFTPTLLNALEFITASESSQSNCLEAIEILKDMNHTNKRKLPADVPTTFIPKKLISFVIHDDGEVNKQAWECSLLFKLHEEIKAGNVYIRDSKRFGNFDDYLLPESQWASVRKPFFQKAGLPFQPDEVPSYLESRLDQAYDQFIQRTAKGKGGVRFDDDGWHLSPDHTNMEDSTKEELERFRFWLSKHMRTIRLPELLIEVDNHLHFTQHFATAAQRHERSPDHICGMLATIMAHGCNIGLYTMESLIVGLSYQQLKRVSDWQITPEAQRQSLAALVNGISSLDVSLHWGEGRTSASDGQRFAYPRKQLQQTYSTKFSDFALEFYSFVADNYAPFYSTPIECQERDAAYVLDGLLYNENDLDLEEHYTDTHGYTEINFAAFAMLGKRFCPRIRNHREQRIYRINPDREYGPLTSLLSRADRTIHPAKIAEQWDRMGRFYASLQAGHTTASIALKRLAGYSKKNQFYRANRDFGRVFKTEFLLDYITQPLLRQRIRRGLLKVEELHQLARDIFYAKRGRISAREIHQQLNSCSCLTLIAACVIYWQAKEITRILQQHDPDTELFDPSLIAHISPIGWDNVILYGEYRLDPSLIK
jgi:TnpA family transposase